jgi:hypothetical protein
MAIKQEMRISDDELSLIKNTFADNDQLLKLLRKVFLPEITASAPLGQNIDLWMTLKIDDLPPEQAIINLKARNTVIQHIEMQLQMLSVLAGRKDESVEVTKERLKKNSSK